MNKRAFTLALLLFFDAAYAYDILTHRDLSARAAAVSELGGANLLRKIGLQARPISDQANNVFANSQGVSMSIVELIRFGAEFEDTRRLNQFAFHFFNPLTGAGLSTVLTSAPSPDWALEDTKTFLNQPFSYRRARGYFLDALTLSAKSARQENWGMTFQTIGHVIHHLQDMAQPQHTRDDFHCDLGACEATGIYGGLATSYESWTRDNARTSLFDGYAPVYSKDESVAFSNPRKFWTTSAFVGGVGIAEFSNRYFVTAGRNIGATGFALPAVDRITGDKRDISLLCAESALKGQPPCPTGIRGAMTFFSNNVNDGFRPTESGVNARATSSSIFDADLKKKFFPPTYSVNRFTYDAAHEFLLKRAVGFSAGIINYFFRADISLKKAAGDGFVIKNDSPEQMAGRFELYYDDINDNRYLVRNASWTLTIPTGGTSSPVTFDAPLSPVPKRKHQYMLVFVGAMGEEVPQTGFVGAVGASLVRADPFPPAFSGWRYALQGPSNSGGDIVCAASLGGAVNQWNMKNANPFVKLVLDPASQLNQDATSLLVGASASVIDICEGSMQASSRGVLYGSDAGLLGVKPMTNRQILNGSGQVVAIGSGEQLVFYQTIDCPAGYRVTTEPFAVVTAAEVNEVLHPIISCQP